MIVQFTASTVEVVANVVEMEFLPCSAELARVLDQNCDCNRSATPLTKDRFPFLPAQLLSLTVRAFPA